MKRFVIFATGDKITMNCSRTCAKYKAKKPGNSSRYASGQKCCSQCSIFIKYDGIFCPCCNTRLRTKPKTRNQKEKLRESLKKQGFQLIEY